MPLVTVSLSPDLAAKVKAAVDNGQFASDSEVIRRALQIWSRENEIDLSKTSAPLVSKLSKEADVARLFEAFKAGKLNEDSH